MGNARNKPRTITITLTDADHKALSQVIGYARDCAHEDARSARKTNLSKLEKSANQFIYRCNKAQRISNKMAYQLALVKD